MRKVVVESRIPFVKGVLEPWAQVTYADTITPRDVQQADALLVRTRTQCDHNLLAGSRVQFIGTATIGTDHINQDYCASHGITVASAPGCNAPAVAQWVLASIGHWMAVQRLVTSDITLGVVGVGHVGSIVARWAQSLGMKVLLNDPPLEQSGRPCPIAGQEFATLGQITGQCNVITFHTPLTSQGQHATQHLCDEAFLHSAQRCRLLLNAARGGVCDNEALAAWPHGVALDCWEHEPHVLPTLLHKAFIATPHIAGYSLEGKQRGTAMVLRALARHFGWDLQCSMPAADVHGAACVTLGHIMDSYNPLLDTARLKDSPRTFENQRNTYNLRHETTSLPQ